MITDTPRLTFPARPPLPTVNEIHPVSLAAALRAGSVTKYLVLQISFKPFDARIVVPDFFTW